MKYTFMTAEGQEKTVNISDEVFAQGKRDKLSVRETIDRFLSDEGYIVDPTVAELTNKAKAAGINNAGKTSSGKRKAPTRKPDMVKRELIEKLADFVASLGYTEAASFQTQSVETVNIERIIAFSVGDDKYEITLSKKRKPKN